MRQAVFIFLLTAVLVNAAAWAGGGMAAPGGGYNIGGFSRTGYVDSDGEGGVYAVTASAEAAGFVYKLVRVDQNENIQWQRSLGDVSDPDKSAGSSDGQRFMARGSDGGVIVSWAEVENGVQQIFAQKIDKNGSYLWGNKSATGEVVVTGSASVGVAALIADKRGGAILAWGYPDGSPATDIRAGRLDQNGQLQWENEICSAINIQQEIAMVSDGANGAVLAWRDYRKGTVSGGDPIYEIYAQSINGDSGGVRWLSNGVKVSKSSSRDQRWPIYAAASMVEDGSGGAVLTISDGEPGASGTTNYAVRINSNGNIVWTKDFSKTIQLTVARLGNGFLFAAAGYDAAIPSLEGITVSKYALDGTEVFSQPVSAGSDFYPSLASDGSGGAIAAWVRGTLPSTGIDSWSPSLADDIYAQKIDGNGSIVWDDQSNGLALVTRSKMQTLPQAVEGDSGTAHVIWADAGDSTTSPWYNSAKTYTAKVSNAGITISLLVANATASSDPDNPTEITDPTPEISGSVSPVPQTLTVNGNPVAVSSGGGFSYQPTLPFAPGQNTITVAATDTFGNSFQQQYYINVGEEKEGRVTTYVKEDPPGTWNIVYNLSADADVDVQLFATNRPVRAWKFTGGTSGGLSGYNVVAWQGTDTAGKKVGNGIYVYKIIDPQSLKVLAKGYILVYE